ncbi:hypothetical protein [Streptomyces nigrescens]|uniref:hypothetical protein n=1 Tax=Streptomyces nigrescens TaxID=1920 RepID=UPI0036A104EB
MSATIPGALADYLTTNRPDDQQTRATLDAARRGRGRTLVITPTTAVLHVISAYADAILENGPLHPRALKDAARLWIKRAGHAPAEQPDRELTYPLAAEQQLDAVEADESAKFAATTRAVDAVEYAEHVEAAVETVEDAEALYAAQLVTDADATDGTWRGEWIGQQADDGLFALSPEVEQGALFIREAPVEQPVETGREPVVARVLPAPASLARIKAKANEDRAAHRPQ